MASVTGSNTTSSVVPKACENCRSRKVRCNRVIPCSNCLSSGLSCRPAKVIEHRPRIIVSNNYEKQIELISTRLSGIEQSLRTLSVSKTTESPKSQDGQSISSAGENTPVPVQYEGLSSFQHQSIQASEFAESLGGSTTQELTSAIQSLKDMINMQTNSTGALQLSFTDMRARVPQVELLPSPFVIAVLKSMRESPSVAFLASNIRDVVEFERICQRAYFPTEQLSLGEQTTMFGLFYSVIQESKLLENDLIKDYDSEELFQLCRKNFFAGIETFEIMTVPAYWNIVALVMGAAIAMDDRKTTLAFTLTNTACRHVLALGYHREITLRKDDPELADRKRWIFWTVYAMDKSLSLNLGRASCMPEFDVDVEYPKISQDPGIRAWDAMTLASTKISRVQGQVYEQLYSSAAAKKSTAERTAIVDHLAGLLHQYQDEMRMIERGDAYAPEIFDMLARPTEIVYYSLLTTLYRASSKSDELEVSSRCFEAARKALEMHLEFFPRFTGDILVGAYVNWILLYCSFTPFVVVFLHSIVSQSLSEVELLESVASSLERTRFMAEEMDRLYQTCQTFCRVAKTFIESRQKLVGTYNEQKNSFVFPDMTNHQYSVMMYGEGVGGPQAQFQLPDYFAQENGLPPTSNEIGEMSMFFGNWMGSHQPVMDLLSMDLALDAE